MIASALILLLAAHGQQQPTRYGPLDTDEIVVVGERGRTERRAAGEFIAAVGVAAGIKPAARWVLPMCPKVLGLAPAQAATVEARIRAIASEVRVPLARAGCKANAVISFTSDARAVVRDVLRRDGAHLREVPADAKQALLHGDAPVRWWYSTEYRSRDGSPPVDIPMPGMIAEDENGNGKSMPGWGASTPSSAPSIVSTTVQRTLYSATVVVEINKDRKVPLAALADYAALVSLAEVRQNAVAQDSILELFSAANPSTELSRRDLAFLRALYRLSLDREARRQRHVLVRDMIGQAETQSRQ